MIKRARFIDIGLALVALSACVSIFQHPTFLAGGYDWRYFQTAMETARRSVVWFHQLPLYNPWMCGGEPQLANPQSVAGSPTFAFVVLFGTAVGERLMLIAFVAIGLLGAYRLARALGLQELGAIATALCFGLSGWVIQHFAIGHVSFFGATLIPYLLYFYLRARDERCYAIAAGAIAAIIVAQGGTSTAAMAGIALTMVVLADLVRSRRVQPIGLLFAIGVAAMLLGAYRLFPALEFAIDHPRHVVETDAQSLSLLLRGAISWSATGTLPGHRYGTHEYLWRLPFFAWPLLVAGLFGMRRHAFLVGIALVLCLAGAGIALGDTWPYGPWWLMRKLPVLRDLRVPSRYVLLTALGCSLLAGLGLDLVSAWLRGRGKIVAMILLATLAIDGVIYGNTQLAHVFGLPPQKIDHAGFVQVRGNWRRMLELVYANQGVIGCDEEAPLTRALKLDEGPGPQLRLEDPSSGELIPLRWSPNAIELEVRLSRPTTLLVNLNWNEHWKSDVGEVVRVGEKWPADKDGGRLGVRLPAMRGTIGLRYRPRSFVLGLLVSMLSIAALVVLRRKFSAS